MSQAFDDIVKELDHISQQEKYALRELLEKKLATANGSDPQSDAKSKTTAIDPLAGFRVSTGIPDLAEHFDEYRFGRQAR